MSDTPVPKDISGKVEVTGQSLIETMREIVAPPGKKGTWLRKLNNRQLSEVYQRLKLGQPAYRIAQIAKIDWGINKKSEIKSMARAVRSFKKSVLGLIELEKTSYSTAGKEEGRKLSVRARHIVSQLDGLGRQRWLCEIATERVAMCLEREKKTLPLRVTDDAMKGLNEYLRNYMDYQFKLGVLDSAPSEVNLNIKGRFDTLLQQSVQPGTAVIEAADKWLELCEKSALTLQQNTKGKYELVKPDDGKEGDE